MARLQSISITRIEPKLGQVIQEMSYKLIFCHDTRTQVLWREKMFINEVERIVYKYNVNIVLQFVFLKNLIIFDIGM